MDDIALNNKAAAPVSGAAALKIINSLLLIYM